ncbi:hypothetical protein FA95DRAFT_1613490 [Auriscalpium vulgare]|uniref:Uncharacterized protein n=1 Tax=Auriscalpium vulgare TaxID=40419 RepID=A0ACB8R3C3_9AGAM|nr:hypothetical protein FA95DRAFT_1613490 [Auriscalpium vulgare]
MTDGSSTAAPKLKPAYDPQRKWGLTTDKKPQLSADGGATVDIGQEAQAQLSADVGATVDIVQEAQACAQRKKYAKDEDRAC